MHATIMMALTAIAIILLKLIDFLQHSAHFAALYSIRAFLYRKIKTDRVVDMRKRSLAFSNSGGNH